MKDLLKAQHGLTDADLKSSISDKFTVEIKQRALLYYVRLAYATGYNKALKDVRVDIPQKIGVPAY